MEIARAAQAVAAEGARVAALPLDAQRARVQHEVDAARALLARAGRPVTCGARCYGCCRAEVTVTEEEVDRIVPLVQPDAWFRLELRAMDTPAGRRRAFCPLLDLANGTCTVYEERPLACRAYMVTTPPSQCYPEVGEARVAKVLDPLGLAVAIYGALKRSRPKQVTTLVASLRRRAANMATRDGSR